MNPRNDWKELLIRYHSGELDAATAEQLERQLEQSPELQQQLEHVKEIDRFLQRQSKLEQPSKKFTEQVMYSITLPANSTVMSSKTGWFLLFSILSITGVALIFLSNGFFDSYTIPLNVHVQSLYFEKLPSPDFSFPFLPGKWVVSAFLVLNLVIGFILLDRTILKPYFQRRAEEFSV